MYQLYNYWQIWKKDNQVIAIQISENGTLVKRAAVLTSFIWNELYTSIKDAPEAYK